ncbi:MAG: hypothetical protein B7Z75_12330 [Acidocella sp. 20-57-95]|nr:MAG: hypothetical protein B7Z75_12330 [Acidocella sp. 20-57-95]OYV59048.1 MAG: hypothetical protein B7Z71_08885 [Acidocella sp. 21-58-7]HQT64009.1 hypothetical protein [Acidocella sp.]HQU04750.1 hypothetical protein [Acidocella sp.]
MATTWTNANGGDWAVASNWNSFNVPGSNQSGGYVDAIINNGAVVTIGTTVGSTENISGLSTVTVSGSTLNIYGTLTGIN